MSTVPHLQSVSNQKGIAYIQSISTKTRKVKCPVRSYYFGKPTAVVEYAIPITLITSDRHTQPRKSGRDLKKVAELSDSMWALGQEEGICVETVSSTRRVSEIRLRWGSHRLEGAHLLSTKDASIEGLPEGYIWANVYTYSPSELRKLQSIENNQSKPNLPASQEDNLSTLEEESAAGQMDVTENNVVRKFANMTEEEQVEQLDKYISSYMPSQSTSKKKKALIRKFFVSKTNPYKSDTMSKREMIQYFNAHNTLGLTFGLNSLPYEVAIGNDGKRHSLYTLQFPTEGSTLTSAAHQRAKNNFDVVHIVMALQRTQLQDAASMAKKRKEHKDFFDFWHNKVSKVRVIDFLYYAPQSTPERTAAKQNNNPWVSVDKF